MQLGYVDQSRDTLDGKKTVWEEISGGDDSIPLGKREINSRAYSSAFNFKGADQQKKVGQFSGGERNRVHLAKMLKLGANVLLLDEPTNDLDVDTLRALEEALEVSRAARSSSPTTAGSWTASRPISSPSKATAMSNGSKAISRTTRRQKAPARHRHRHSAADQIQKVLALGLSIRSAGGSISQPFWNLDFGRSVERLRCPDFTATGTRAGPRAAS